jgi:hypothetical protein
VPGGKGEQRILANNKRQRLFWPCSWRHSAGFARSMTACRA